MLGSCFAHVLFVFLDVFQAFYFQMCSVPRLGVLMLGGRSRRSSLAGIRYFEVLPFIRFGLVLGYVYVCELWETLGLPLPGLAPITNSELGVDLQVECS